MSRLYHDSFQNGGDGVPYHIVVQYIDTNDAMMCAGYFENWETANEFIKELEQNDR